ncbi:MAG: amidohydrolase, partial [bacterium]
MSNLPTQRSSRPVVCPARALCNLAAGALAVAALLLGPRASAAGATSAPAAPITVYTAKKIVTMDPGWPEGTAVAVQGGRILSVGRTMDDLAPWLDAAKKRGTAVTIDATFKDHVLLPGFVEAHGHPLIGAVALTRPCLSRFPQPNPYGPGFPGVKDLDACAKAIATYLAANPDDGRLIIFWGYDVAAMGRHLDAAWLDRAANGRAVSVWDASEHFVYASTAAMKLRGVTKENASINGVMVGADGAPNGQFLGATAAAWFLAPEMKSILAPAEVPGIMKYLVDLGWKNGITTTSDMALGMVVGIEAESALTKQFFNSPLAPLRCVSITAADVAEREKGVGDGAVARIRSLEAMSDDKVTFRGVKFFADDAFLSFGMQMTGPGYVDGRVGFWMTKPEDMVGRYRPYWEAGMQIHTHTNGNAGVKAVIDALAGLQAIKPRFDHRFAIQHYGISTPEDAYRMAQLGGIASVNPFYLYARGDINVPYIGTDRAETAARLKTLLSAGVKTALHTDTPVALPQPLESIWIAVNRVGILSGKVLGEAERITPEEALRMVTIDAAISLGVEENVGSIRAGKFADFAVLDASPLDVDPLKIRDIGVWGIVVGGVKH